MDNQKKKNLYKAALVEWGSLAQVDQGIEECAELIAEMIHWKRGRTVLKTLQSEIADVTIMLEQLTVMFDTDGGVSDEYTRKLERLKRRLNHD